MTEIKKESISIHSAAKKYGIPKSTLNDKVNGRHCKSHGRPNRLSPEEEEEIVQTCLVFAEWGYGLGKKEILTVISDYVKSRKKAHLFPKGVPGEDWWRGFMLRHPSLSLRAKAVTPEIINHWFMDVLKPILDRADLHYHPERIFNADETSFSLCGRPHRVVCKCGAKSPQFFVGGTGKENITVQGCMSASGTFLPPYILYTGQQLMFDQTQGGPLGMRYGVSPKGWMTKINFLDWFRNQFIPALPEERPVLLILDGYKSHIKYEVRELAKQHSIEIAKLPSHTTHVLQPLDVSTFKPLKEAYDTVAHNFFRTHRRYINKRDFPALLATAWKTFKPEMAINGFRKTGILPFNKDAVEASAIHLSAPYQHHSQANEDPALEQLPQHSEKPPSTDRELMDDPVESNTYDLDPPSIVELLGDEVQEATEVLNNNSGAVSRRNKKQKDEEEKKKEAADEKERRRVERMKKKDQKQKEMEEKNKTREEKEQKRKEKQQKTSEEAKAVRKIGRKRKEKVINIGVST